MRSPVTTRTSTAIRVVIVDENEMFALGLRAALAGHPQIEVTSGEAMDVAVVSPAVAGERTFSCPLVVCGESPPRLAEGNCVLAALPRSTLTPNQLLASIQAAAAGLRVSACPISVVSRLDGRRLDVLRLLASGADTREIALSLGYSDRTIKSVIREIQLALGTRNRAQAVAEGVRQGLIGLATES
ncbi:MAG: response regulator transcription factor [Acidimicrobiia bacterium]